MANPIANILAMIFQSCDSNFSSLWILLFLFIFAGKFVFNSSFLTKKRLLPRSDCRIIAIRVPGGRSLFLWKGTVTIFRGCSVSISFEYMM